MKQHTRRFADAVAHAAVAVALAAVTCMTNEAIAQTSHENALRAFEVVRSVLQHPRCQNCHIPGDSPYMDDAETRHEQHREIACEAARNGAQRPE